MRKFLIGVAAVLLLYFGVLHRMGGEASSYTTMWWGFLLIFVILGGIFVYVVINMPTGE